MKNSFMVHTVCFLLLSSYLIFPQPENNKIRVGVFDSRCVALVYGRSNDFMKLKDSVDTAYSNAKEEDNKIKIKDIEQLKSTVQVLLHQQVFSNGSIINIMEKVKEKFPTIAKQNNLKLIVSKWEVMFADESIELVDITNQLTELFNPDEATKKIIENIKAMEPVPIEKISINPMD